MKNFVTFVSCTQRDIPSKDIVTDLNKCYIEQAERSGSNRGWEMEMVYRNKTPLPMIYNAYIDEKYRDQYVIFVHDDVSLNFKSVIWELHNAFKEYDIVGVAGSTPTRISRPALWHLMGDRTTHSGAVAHTMKGHPGLQYMTSFGPYPRRCLLLDGVFLAINISKLLDNKVKFDTTNPAIAHFYDLDFCLSANQAGLKMGTWPIYITHNSPGLNSLENPEWKKAQEWFINKWAPHLKNN
jgi:hypothetical protein